MESETIEATENGSALADETNGADGETKPRRTPLSFVEKLERMRTQKVAALEKVKTRETAQGVELDRTRLQREAIERELLGIERAKAEAD